MAVPDSAGPTREELTTLHDSRSVADLRARLRDGDRGLAQRFLAGEDPTVIVAARAALVDDLLLRLWERSAPGGDCALLAVGGYGRQELFPHSDVDLLVLVPPTPDAARDEALTRLVAALWDIGVVPALAVRDVAQCLAACAELDTATALFEARHLAGERSLSDQLLTALAAPGVWPPAEFLAAKLEEQRLRHARAGHSAQGLEPDLRADPGGLRDLHTIGWVARRLHGTAALADLEARGVLTAEEHADLAASHRTLTRLRYALHLAAGRREDRLLFDLQLRLARQFGHRDDQRSLAVESFMQDYYRAAGDLRALNELLLGQFAASLAAPSPASPLAGDHRFVVQGGLLEPADADLFAREPAAMFDIFLAWQAHPELLGLGPRALRALRRDRGRIDADFRADPRNRTAFMRILRGPQGVTHVLRRMAHSGLLGRYLPAFGAVAGRMQFDLFHAWTVDEHTLFVVANLRRFALPRCDHEFPLCSRLMQSLAAPELVYLAGLFHDIAKGRGGDHSTLGADEARAFCLAHGLEAAQAETVAWLVQHHLALSVTAQKRDLGDPAVIADFATLVGDPVRLDMLYLLTVADVRATNPRLWNSWKARLFSDLRERTRAVLLAAGGEVDAEPDARRIRAEVLAALAAQGIGAQRLPDWWATLDDEYFLQHPLAELVWHAEAFAALSAARPALARVGSPTGAADATVLLVLPEVASAFGRAVTSLDRLGLTVLEARLRSLGAGLSLLTMVVLEHDGRPVDPARHAALAAALEAALDPGLPRTRPLRRHLPRQARLFATPTRVGFGSDPHEARTVVELTAADRPGLLGEVAAVLEACDLRLSAAKITTVGERAEDVFFVTDATGLPLRDPARRQDLSRRLVVALDSMR